MKTMILKPLRCYLGDWRPLGGCMADFQNEARKRDLFTDIQFVIGKGESSKTFSAHKTILACGSPVFEKMFYGEMPEKRSVINIEDDDPEAFNMLLSFIYGDGKNLQISSFVCACKFYIIGDKYLVPGIQTVVTQYISSATMDENAFWELIETDIFSCQILEQKLISFIQINISNLLDSEKLFDLPEDLLNIILQMNELNITEYKLLTSVTKWTYHYKPHANSDDLLIFFQHIRFSTLTIDEFLNFTSTYPCALDTQSSFDILKHLNDKATFHLPHWCEKSKCYRNVKVHSTTSDPEQNMVELYRMMHAQKSTQFYSYRKFNRPTYQSKTKY